MGIAVQTLAEALEAEHRSIDVGIDTFLAEREAFLADRDSPLPGPGGGPATDALLDAMRALRRHIFLEEEFLFGPLREAGLVAPIFVMLREHGEIWDTMESLLSDVAVKPASDGVATACRALLEQLSRHNVKEEPIIYPEVDAVTHGPAGERLRAWLADGEVPDGWRCARAGALPGGRLEPQPSAPRP